MGEIEWCGVLAVLNALTAYANGVAFKHTEQTRDFTATCAWTASTCYWVVRLILLSL